MKHLLIISVLVAFGTGAPRDFSERIAGGSPAVEGEFPYIASVQLERRHYCSGMIYNDRWILTTASCVSRSLPSQLQVVVGVVSFIIPAAQQQTITVSSVVTHPQYDSVTNLNDLALISLSRPVVFGSAVQAIRYDEVDEAITTAITMGWGATVEGGVEVTKLRKTVLTLPADCSSYAAEFNNNYMICAGSDVSSPCQYDEGSPLVQNGIAVGIMSKNKGCTAPYTPSIFTRLSIYYYWLNAVGGQQTFTTLSAPATTLSTVPSTAPTAPCFNCETTTTTTIQTTIPTAPTAPCINCETPTATTTIQTTISVPTAPCLNCEPPTATTTVQTTISVPTAPCLNCEPTSTTTPKPIIPTAPCFNCVP